MDRLKTREDIHRELQELLAASKASSRDGQPNSLSRKQSLLGVADDPSHGADNRRSNDKRNSSSELRNELPTVLEQGGQLNHHCSAEVLPMHPANPKDSGKGATPQPTTELGSTGGTWATPTSAYQLHAEIADHKDSCLPHWIPFRAIHATLKKHPVIWVISVLVMLLLTAAGVAGVMAIAAQETRDKRISAQGFALNDALAFERQLSQMFGPLLSLSAIIRSNPSYAAVNATFDAVAKELMDQMPTDDAVTALVAAPQGVLRNFYPLEGYCTGRCEHINMNLFRVPNRRQSALEAVRSGVLTMQGPILLSQGYFGVVGRQPIFVSPAAENETWGAPDGPAYECDICYNATAKRRFWGFVNAIVNLDGVVNGSDSRTKDLAALNYLFRMYKIEDAGPFVIAVSNPPPQDPVVTEIQVPGGVWMLEVSPESGWVPVWRAPIIAVVVLVSCLFGLLLGAILISSRLQSWLQATINALNQEKRCMDVLLARQYNLISCVLQHDGDGSFKGHDGSVETRTLTKIEDMRRRIGVTTGSTGVDELQLMELIDEGTYGKVFKGLWRGSVVAVKSMVLPAKMSGAEKRERMAIMEAAISSAMNHPNIVQTYTYIIKPCSSSVGCAHSSEGGSSSVVELANDLTNFETAESSAATLHNFEVSLVLEYCDWGSLRVALDAGAFFAEDNSLNYAAILDTAADVARAMMHLHKNQVLHSDLKVWNILLKSDASSCGCIAKVADFGLAVRLDPLVDTHVSAFQGTMSHMAPEALLHGRISKASDMYSFGITLWELFTGGQAYQGIPRALVGHNVAVLGLRPALPPFTPPEYRELIKHCWHQEPQKRPTFENVSARLVAMRQALAIPQTPRLQPYKLHVREVSDRRNNDEQDVAVAAANANDLMQLGSLYISSNGGSIIQPGANGSRIYEQLPNDSLKFVGRTLGTGSQLERISDTEAEELEAEREHQHQQQSSTGHQTEPTAAAAAASGASAAAASGKAEARVPCYNSTSNGRTDPTGQQQQQGGDIEQGQG